MQLRPRPLPIIGAVLAAIILICFGWLLWPEPQTTTAQTSEPPIAISRPTEAPAARVEISAPVLEDTAPAVVAVEPLPEEPALAIRQDVRWRAPMPEPVFAKFREWTVQFAVVQSERLLAEGIALAEERRTELADLIDKNPQRALELALPVAVRRALPAEVAARVEEL